MKRDAEAKKYRERRILCSRHRNEHVSELAHICHRIEKLVITMEKNLIDISESFQFGNDQSDLFHSTTSQLVVH